MNYYGIPWLVCILASLLAVALGFGDNILDRVLEVKLTLNNRYLIGIGLKDLMFCALLEKDKIFKCNLNHQISWSNPDPSNYNSIKRYRFSWRDRYRAEVVYDLNGAKVKCLSEACKIQNFTNGFGSDTGFLRLNPQWLVHEAYWDIGHNKFILKPVTFSLQNIIEKKPQINFFEFQRELANFAKINFYCFRQVCLIWKLHTKSEIDELRTIAVIKFVDITEPEIYAQMKKSPRYVPNIYFSQFAMPLGQLTVNSCGLYRELTSRSIIPIIASAMPNNPTKLHEHWQQKLHHQYMHDFYATNLNGYIFGRPSDPLPENFGKSSRDLSLLVLENRFDIPSQDASYKSRDAQVVDEIDSQGQELNPDLEPLFPESSPDLLQNSITSEKLSGNSNKWCPCSLQVENCQDTEESLMLHLPKSPNVSEGSSNLQNTDVNLFTHQFNPLPSANSFKHQQDILSNDFSHSASSSRSPEQASQHEYYEYYTELQDFNDMLDNNLA